MFTNAASRRQRQFERRYNTFRKFTATEDVNYTSHTSRSSVHSESITQRTDEQGRSSSSEIITSSETRSLPVYIAIQDFTPEPGDTGSIPLEQGQIVEVLDKKNAASWLIRTKARPPKSGWVPGSYFETPTEYYKQRRRTRELAGTDLKLTEEQEAIVKRDQVYLDLLRSEEEFVDMLHHVVDNYVRALESEPLTDDIRSAKDDLIANFKELYNFHANILLKGLQYYSDDPSKVGQTFIRLERDFENHIHFRQYLPEILKHLSNPVINKYLQDVSDEVEAGAKSYEDYVKATTDRMLQYQNYFKEFVKYTSRAKMNTKSMQKALELTLFVPQCADDMVYINNIVGYTGEVKRLGRLFRHDNFVFWEDDEGPKDCYAYLFKTKLMLTKRENEADRTVYKCIKVINLDKCDVGIVTGEEDTIELTPTEPGERKTKIRAKEISEMEFVRQAWIKDITEMKESAIKLDGETETTTDMDFNLSDIRSEFSEHSTLSRSLYGPEEGPPRKKIKSPPVISPTASSTSLYSGGSSSIDWTTTGTTLDMQGTRVTRTQYGFRTLQESSAKMCLKVTGYPLPDITWYKDDELLKEDERHTFYSDEDGFFALTIDPVKIEDTGRYTCMATNEYGQASTSAFFRVHKVEKEAAPPAFLKGLKDQEAKEGDIVSFECDVEGWPEPELIWLIDDQPLRQSHDFRLEYDGQHAKLEIRDAQPEDSGVYIVRIKNEYGSAESNAKLTIEPDPDKNYVPPEFQATIEDVECNEGDTVKFKAVCTGDPAPEIIWSINGIPLSESDKTKLINEDGILILIINDVSRHFDGIVTCQAINRLGMQSCEARLKVRVPPAPPQFLHPLEDKIVLEGDMIVIDTEISGFPPPKVKFELKGKEIISGENNIIVLDRGDGNYRIEIGLSNIEKHSGEIVCTAINDHGQAESRARIVVEPIEDESKSAPTFIKDLEDQTVEWGKTATFETIVDGKPNPGVMWFINGVELSSNSPGVHIEVSNNATHRILIDSSQYAGTVLCRAENSVGLFETKAKLTVLERAKSKKPPQFTRKLADQIVVESTNVVFEVHVDAEPNAKFRWYLNDKEVVEQHDMKIREFVGSCKLELSEAKIAQAGSVRCVAENSEGIAESTANLQVTKKSYKPKFDKKPNNVSVKKGSEARFEVEADALPDASYQWCIDGRKVDNSTDGITIQTINKTSILIIDTSKVSSSTISVVASNEMGEDETGALLEVQEEAVTKVETIEIITNGVLVEHEKIYENAVSEEELDVSEVSTEKHEVKHEIKIMPKKLVVTRPLNDQQIKFGENAQFNVVIEGADSVEWYMNDTKLSHDIPGILLEKSENYEFYLTIDSCKESGVIAVKAANEVGSVESSGKLGILMELKEPPSFITSLHNIELFEGDDLSIYMETKTDSKFIWKIDRRVLEDGKDEVKITTSNNGSTLEIRRVEKRRSGLIEVIAENDVGQNSCTGELIIKEKIEGAKIIEDPRSMSIKESESAVFTVIVKGIPPPTVQWTLNERILNDTEEHIIIKSFENKHSLTIENAVLRQAGEIVATATNSSGSDSRSAVLKIEADVTKPVFKTHLIDRKVEENEPLRWDISFEKPFKGIKISWILNGEELVANEKIQIMDHGDGSYHLTIAEAKVNMSGKLVCKATNSFGTSESRATVEVSEIDKKPEFVKYPQNLEVIEEDMAKFSAIISAKPAPTITWFHNRIEIESSEEFRIKFEESTGKTSLKINKTKEVHNGKILLKAENKLGSAEATAELIVSKKKEPPRFLADMDSRQISEGECARFCVTVAGYPLPDVQWFHNGKPIVQSEFVKINAENDVHTLVISNAEPQHGGEISCEAKNSAGSKKQIATLVVKMVGSSPIFQKNINDILVEEGSEIVMEAKIADAKPKPTITWLRDGSSLKNDRFVTSITEEGTLQLRVEKATLDDKCRITVRAENQFGSAECSASIGVQKRRPAAKPAFLSNLTPISVTEGETLEAKLIVTGDPQPFAKWYINDQLVCATEDTELTTENGVYTLKIHGVTKNMTGTIKCTAYNKAGEVSTQGPLKVTAPIPVEFETTLCDATCREGDTLKLKAVLMGEPTPVVTWYVNGKQLEESQNIKTHAEKGTYTVTIKDITCDFSGKVVCEAVNEYGKASSEALLLVLPRGEPPDFLEWLSNVKARQNSQVTHKVVFIGDPKPILTWYINGQEVNDSEEISIVTTDNTSILVIKSFNPEKHVGEIICKAENDAGEVSCTASMGTYTSDMFSESESEAMVEEALEVEDFGVIENEEELMESERTATPVMAPKFIKKIKDTRATRGHQAIFECVVPDTKGVCCKWLKDGKEIELIARIRVQTRVVEGFTTSELIIDNVQPEDAGKYEIVVENIGGSDTCEATLNVVEVMEKKETHAPEFVIALSDKASVISGTVIFECKVTGEPIPTVSWFHEKKNIVEETAKIIIESDESIHRLMISSVDFDDRGQYTCKAKNIVGETQSIAMLTVQAEAPQFVRSINDKELCIGEKLIFDCAVKGIPQPFVQFFDGSTRITSNERISIEHDVSHIHWRMVINKTEETDFKKYRIVATNAAGSAEAEAEVRQKDETEMPKFEKGMKDYTVLAGEEILMDVKVTGRPLPDINWFKNEKLIEEDDSNVKFIKNDNGYNAIMIKDASQKDTGEYSVEISNIEGKVKSSANITVIGIPEKPEIVEDLKEIKTTETQTAELKITVIGTPEPLLEWSKDDQLINIDNKHYITKDGKKGEHTLVIKSVRLEDAGKYTCKATNLAGTVESQVMVFVEQLIKAPQFNCFSSEINVKEKETAELSVTVSGQPVPQVSWFKDDQPVVIDNKHYVTKDGEQGEHMLIIKSVNLEDAARYICKAHNVAGTIESQITVSVEQLLKAPHFDSALSETTVKENETAELSVTISGQPEPQVLWFKNEQPVVIDKKHILTKKDEFGVFTLVIKNARVEDIGEYSCEAVNKAGSIQSTAKFVVISEKYSPEFIETIGDIEVIPGEKLELVCSIKGKPEPEVIWKKDGIEICIDNNHVIKKDSESGRHTLMVKEVNKMDVGAYSCIAINSEGETQAVAEVKFPKYTSKKVKEEEVQPMFIDVLESQSIIEGETTKLECRINEEAKPEVKWYHGKELLKPDDHFIVEELTGGILRLTIVKAVKEDAGPYNCEIINQAGKAETSATLVLKYAKIEGTKDAEESSPIFIEPLKSYTAKEGEVVKFDCRINKESKPEIKWYHGDELIKPDENHIIEKLDDGINRMTILHATKEDIGAYCCEALNIEGTAKTAAELNIQYAEISQEKTSDEVVTPIFLEPLEAHTVTEGEIVEFKCRVDEKSQPDIKWYHDDKAIKSDAHFIIEALEDGVRKLTLLHATKEDVGDYRCEAVNISGQAKTEAKLNISYAETSEELISQEKVVPIFLEQLETHKAIEGESVELRCRVNEESKPEVRWYKGDELIKADENFVIEELGDGVRKLTLLHATKEDVGAYRCEAINLAGQAKTETDVELGLPAASEEVQVKFIEKLHDLTAYAGDLIELKCTVECTQPGATIIWQKDGEALPEKLQPKLTPDGTVTLKFEKVMPEQSGVYKCIASYGKTSSWTECNVSVSETPVDDARSPPEFVELLKSCTIKLNEVAILKCKLKGLPRPEVVWSKDGDKLNENSNNEIEYLDDGTVMLRIKKVALENIGEYRCDASNELGNAWSVAPITLKAEYDVGEAPDFTEPVRPVVIAEGETAILEGTVSGEPQPQIKWYRGEILLENNDRIRIETLASGVQRLIIKNAKESDKGEYQCSASNEFGDVWCDATLSVTVSEIAKEEPAELAAPKFLKTLEESTRNEGETILLECKIVGQPMPEIKWFKDKKEIHADGVHLKQETLTDGTARLVIYQASKADAGEFRCEARNSTGTARTEAIVSVLYAFEEPSEHELAPEFSQELKSIQANEGERICFECCVSGVPIPVVTWYKDGKKLDTSEKVKIESYPDGSNRLIIDEVNLDDQGNYRCEATNASGAMSSKAPLTVDALETLKVTKQLKDMLVHPGMEIKLTVEIEGQPKSVKWFKGKDEIRNNTRTKLTKDHPQSFSLTISNCKLSDTDSYRVAFSTDAETVESSSNVTVEEKASELVFKKGLNPTKVKRGSTLTLEIEVQGKPKEVKWYKANSPIDSKSAKIEKVNDEKFRILIPNVKEADAGEYKISVSNESYSIESKAEVIVEPEEEFPKLVRGLQPVLVKVGDEVIFEVETDGNVQSVKWYKNNIKADDIRTKKINENCYQLIIPRATPEDEADYKVIVSNDAGSVDSSAKLTVRTTSPGIEILKGLEDIKVTEGENIHFEITSTVVPDEIHWLKDGEELEISKGIKCSVDGVTCRLTIPSVSESDTAEYKIVLSKKGQSAFSSCVLNVQPSPLTFTRYLDDQAVTPGEKVALVVESNFPPKQVKWYKNGKEVGDNDKPKAVKVDDRTYRLEISSAAADDTAEYKVVLSNAVGEIESSAKLTVKEMTPALEILKRLEDLSIIEEDTATLLIKTNLEPLGITWYKDGDEIPSDRAEIKRIDETTYQLVIPHATEADTADYKVVVTKKGESSFSSCSLVVKVPSLEMLKKLEDQVAYIGEKVLLEIETNVRPKTVKWYKNGEVIIENKKIKMIEIDDKTYQLEINSAKEDDSADYRVILSNQLGEVESSAKLTVKQITQLEIAKGLQDFAAIEGDTVALEIKASQQPDEITWYKNGEEIKDNNRIKIEKVSETTYKLLIPQAVIGDTADYKVIISKEDATAFSSCSLVVKVPQLEFIKALDDQTVAPGDSILLEIEVNAKPKQIKWYKNGKAIEANKKMKPKELGDKKFGLELIDVTKEDAANYKVSISNEVGSEESSCALTVKLPTIKFVEPLKDETVLEYNKVLLGIEVNTPAQSVIWYKNGKEIAPSDKIIPRKISDTKYQIEIPEADKDDTAEYTVVVSNEDSTADSKCSLTVKLPTLKITRGLKDQIVRTGEKALLGVEINARPRTIKWYKNGKEITPGDKVIPRKINDTNYQLEIPDATIEHSADYKVVFSNEESTADSSCSLTVKLPPQKPTIVHGIENQFIPVGAPLHIQIETTGNPDTVKWFKNGKNIVSDKINVVKLDDNLYKLQINETSLEDSGSYSVEIENEAGRAKSTGEIAVEDKLTFITPLKDVIVVEDEKAEFFVETNVRAREVKWYKNGQQLRDIPGKIKMKSDDTKFRLTIDRAEKDDAAEFTVIVSNSAGDSTSAAKLTVKKRKGQPKIVKGLEDQVITESKELVLEIKVEGEPDEIRWYKDGVPLSSSARIKEEKLDDTTYKLIISETTVKDAGMYNAEAVNEVGKARTSGEVEVDVKPEIIKGLEDSQIEEGDEQIFRIEVNAPVRTVKWYKNGQEIVPSRNIITKKIGPKKYELEIPKATLSDTATYKVVLGNSSGECDSEAALTVKKPNILHIINTLKDVEVNEGEMINFSVEVEGIPDSTVWYKNGKEMTPDERIKIENESGKYCLSIMESVIADGAAYRIVLSNERGEVQSGAIAHVKAKKMEPTKIAPMYITPLSDIKLVEGETLTLKCKVGGEPMPELKWQKDGKDLERSDRIVIRMAFDGTATLRILDTLKSDAGTYRVHASNSSGECSSQCDVKIFAADELPCAPEFIVPLKDTIAKISEKAQFSIKLRGIPQPTLRWYINRKEVKSGMDGIIIQNLNNGNYLMVIESVQSDHNGTIQCVASNEVGEAECEAVLSVSEPRLPKAKVEEGYAPRFNVPLWDRCIPEGQLMSIECHLDAKPTADVHWTKDSMALEESDRVQITNTADGACRVRINAFSVEDVGVYKCKATNIFGETDTKATLTVQSEKKKETISKREYAPRFNPPLFDKFGEPGDKIYLSCKLDASPKASVIWYKDGFVLRNDGKTEVSLDDDGNCILIILSASDSDDGAYRCVASNKMGTTNTACTVTIKKYKEEMKKEGEEPFFTKGLSDKWLERGDTLKLTCAVVGDPQPEIRWYRNGTLIRSSGRYSIENQPDGICTLVVENCTMSDEGIYRCEAENVHGKARTQSTIHVEVPYAKMEMKQAERGDAPRFIIPLEDCKIFLGSVIELECRVAGNPMPTVKWSKDGGPLMDDSRYEWEVDVAAGSYKLKIRAAEPYDEGTYRCVATNDLGSATSKAFVTIDDGSSSKLVDIYPPFFLIPLRDVRAAEGQQLKLECKIDGFPLTSVIWYKDGERVVPNDHVQTELDDEGWTKLIIPKCNLQDEGIYRIIATNMAGSAHDKCSATVKQVQKDRRDEDLTRDHFDAYRAPKVIIPLESCKLVEQSNISLLCKFSGDPRPSIRWFKDGERVYAYGRCKLIESEDGTCELIINSVSRFDAGAYRCVAENFYGSARTICEVVVQLKSRKPIDFEEELREGNAPGFSVPLTIKRAKQGDTIALECVAYGKPFPTIKWLKDGIEVEMSDKIKAESSNDGSQRLILKDLDFASEGFYRCVAANEYGTASTKDELCIEGDRLAKKKKVDAKDEEPQESKPRIRRGLYNMSIHLGSVVEMLVCVTGLPNPEVKWYKNGEEIKSEGPEGRRLIWTDDRALHRCVILKAQPEDEGEYMVEATNKLGVARTEGTLTVIKPREVLEQKEDLTRGGIGCPPGFIRQLKNKHVFSHMPTIFDCLVVGNPPPEVDWFHNGKKIVPSGKVKIHSCGGGSEAIIMLDTLTENIGEYMAVARNIHGTAKSSALLDVTIPHLDEIKFSDPIDITPYLIEEYGFKKMNLSCLPTPPDRGPFIKEVTGHYLTLSWIPTRRSPPRYPQVTYVIEIRELPFREWTLLDYNIPEPVCKVRNLEIGKSYQFRVRAENIYGISDPSPASPPSRLMAPPQPVLDQFKRVIPLLDPYAEKALDEVYAEQYACAPWFAPGVVEKKYCAENDVISITLYVAGYPDPEITWKFRGIDIDTKSPTSRARIVTYGGTETTLTINGFIKEDVGQYQCVAKNLYGEAQQNIYVDIGVKPSFLQPLINKIFSSSKTIRLDVRVEGSPTPELKWMKDWRPIVESSRVRFIEEGPYLRSLMITDPMWRDCGIYSVTAVNDAGIATTTCSVTVEAGGDHDDIQLPPRRKIMLEARKVREIYEIDEENEK